jgi:hypothetical protein
VRAISGNLTVVNPAVGGAVKLIPGDRSASAATAISYSVGRVLANNFMLRLSGRSSATAWGTFAVRNEGSQPIQIVVDVNGYFE